MEIAKGNKRQHKITGVENLTRPPYGYYSLLTDRPFSLYSLVFTDLRVRV